MIRRYLTMPALCMALILLLCGCGRNAEPAPTETAPLPAAVPDATIPADGNPQDVTCLGSYTVSDEEAAGAMETIVATAGDASLTNSQLQVYYWLEVAAFRQSSRTDGPDFSQPLDSQPCQIDDTVNSWQQYFLREALNTWHSHQALIRLSQHQPLPTEEAYQPDAEKYAEYMPENTPATKYLYRYQKTYQPNELHQAYLDAIPQTMDALAMVHNFADADVLAAAIAGPGVQLQDLLQYAQNTNQAYMYLTELGYYLEIPVNEVEQYYISRKAAFETRGIRQDGSHTVDIRHILLIPENAQVAADGTVTASDTDWEACRTNAQKLLKDWASAVRNTRHAALKGDAPADARFAEFAKTHSADTGSREIGGLYADIRPGQLIPELDAWCFNDGREYGDAEILETAYGLHILFFSGSRENWYAAAEAEVLQKKYHALVTDAMAECSMSTDYSAIRLGQAEDNGSFLLPSDLLYPDVAHQRYPSIPLYIQQDYPQARYGNYKLSTHGCGICVLAMITSYMTDEEITPPELGEKYGYYCGKHGSEIIMIDDIPAEYGFFTAGRTYDWNVIDAALKNGQPVISMQVGGYWTRGGHFIILSEITENGRYVVRDSNLLNYKKLPAFAEDCHARGNISANSEYYWIFEKKVTNIPACVRCGGGTVNTAAAIFRQDYHCAKCLTAMERRENYLTSIAG